jgi:cardiolipin synthase
VPLTDLLPEGWFSLHGLLSAAGLLVYAVGSHTLHQRRHPSAAIGWVLMILLLPEAGVPLYLLFGTRKLPKAQARRAAPELTIDETVAPVWTQHLTASMGLSPPLGYRALRIHADGAEASRVLFELIDGARERLDVCTFLVGRDAFGETLVRRLGERARDGVAVRLLIDGVGTLMGGRRDFDAIEAQGVKVVQFVPPLRSPLKWPLRGRTNLRNHRKLVIADGVRLWSGGRNLADEYFEGGRRAPWVDLTFDLSGPLVAEAGALFEADWTFARSGRSGRGAGLPEATVAALRAPRRPAAQLVPTGPDWADDTVHTLLVTACFRARQRVLAVTPYLVPDESLLSALALAARRGVHVDVVVPARSNHRLADIARYRPMRELARAGARLWLAEPMVHAKAVVVDDTLALVGSTNLDSRSLFLNYELMTAFYDPQAVADFARWIETLGEQARPFEARPASLARSVGEGMVLWLAFQL